MATTVPSETTVAETSDDGTKKYGSFLDDPYNMAMYVVLPVMVLVYGGCCVIYCCARLHRYCRRRKRRAMRQRLKNESDSDDDNDNNNTPDKVIHITPAGKKTQTIKVARKDSCSISVVDLTEPTAPPPRRPVPVGGQSGARSKASVTSSHTQGVRPGYRRNERFGMNDAELQMMHLDNQLKAAFKLISSNDVKKEPEAPPRSRPDVCARSDENTRPVKRHTDSKMKFFASDQ